MFGTVDIREQLAGQNFWMSFHGNSKLKWKLGWWKNVC